MVIQWVVCGVWWCGDYWVISVPRVRRWVVACGNAGGLCLVRRSCLKLLLMGQKARGSLRRMGDRDAIR